MERSNAYKLHKSGARRHMRLHKALFRLCGRTRPRHGNQRKLVAAVSYTHLTLPTNSLV